MYPVDSSCRAFRGAQLVSLRREDLLAPAALDGTSFGVFAHIGLFSLSISRSGWLKTTVRRGKKPCAPFRSFCFDPFLCHSSAGRDFYFLYATYRDSRWERFFSSMCIDVAENVEEIRWVNACRESQAHRLKPAVD